MLEFLRGKASDRKLRLFAVACCRLIGHLLKDARCREALEVYDAYADGLSGGVALRRARCNAEAAFDPYNCRRLNEQGCWSGDLWVQFYARGAVRAAGRSDVWEAARQARKAAAFAVSSNAAVPGQEARRTEEAGQAALLHDILGNPFRPVALDPSLLTWQRGTIPKLAEDIYDDRAFDRLPILADALEEAGCTDPDILTHCRSGGDHVRGCWPVDLILGKS
jgi:hypothetical protein